MKVFIVHYNKLVDRKLNIQNQLDNNNLTAEFVEQYTRNNLNSNDKKIFTNNVNDANMAISLSHLYCYKEIAEKYEYGLILEDDAIFDKNFNNNQNIYKKNLKANSLGGGLGASRGTGCYLVSKKCALKITYNIKTYYYNGIYKINDPIDWWLNYVFRRNNFNIYWAEPTISTQGTQNGKYESSH